MIEIPDPSESEIHGWLLQQQGRFDPAYEAVEWARRNARITYPPVKPEDVVAGKTYWIKVWMGLVGYDGPGPHWVPARSYEQRGVVGLHFEDGVIDERFPFDNTDAGGDRIIEAIRGPIPEPEIQP